MSEPTEQILDARTATERAFEYFDAFVRRGGSLSNVLLEMLKYDEKRDRWGIGIGYDLGRQRETEEGSTLVRRQIAREPIRELRSIWIDAKDGRLLEIG